MSIIRSKINIKVFIQDDLPNTLEVIQDDLPNTASLLPQIQFVMINNKQQQ